MTVLNGSSKIKPAAPITLVSTYTCPWAHRTWIALAAANVDFTFKEVDLKNKPDWFLKLTPIGKVPTLVVGDDILYESLITTELIADLFPQAGLLPTDPIARAFLRLTVDRFMASVQTAFHSVATAKEGAAETLLQGIRTFLPYLDKVGPYAANSKSFTLAEALVGPFLARLYLAGRNGFVEEKVWKEITTAPEFHAFHTWATLVIEHPAVKSTFNEEANLAGIKARLAASKAAS